MIDSHCHLDQYPDPAGVANAAAQLGVSIIAVTALPSHFATGRDPANALPRTRLALGLHPLLAEQHEAELDLFVRLVSKTSYVGEVGLDFSRHGRATRDLQVRTFRSVLAGLSKSPKFISLHSRGAEGVVLDMLSEFNIRPAVFHWYTGSTTLAAAIADRGHFFSVNPAMLRSARGRRLVLGLPRHLVLTESDGPYVRIGSRNALPQDVIGVSRDLATLWGEPHDVTRRRLAANFRAATAHVRNAATTDS